MCGARPDDRIRGNAILTVPLVAVPFVAVPFVAVPFVAVPFVVAACRIR
ncbi:MAG: hypothetical protein WBG76_03665 [Ornithinimicrobium sp.]